MKKTEKKKSIKVRMYRQCDYDLLSLYFCKTFSLRDCMKKCITDYVRGNLYHIRLPEDIYDEMGKKEDSDLVFEGMVERMESLKAKKEDDGTVAVRKMKNHVCIYLYFEENEEKDVIEFLGRVRKGYLNSFCKQVFRKYILGGTLLAYFNSVEDREFVRRMQYDDDAPVVEWEDKKKAKRERKKDVSVQSDKNTVKMNADMIPVNEEAVTEPVTNEIQKPDRNEGIYKEQETAVEENFDREHNAEELSNITEDKDDFYEEDDDFDDFLNLMKKS